MMACPDDERSRFAINQKPHERTLVIVGDSVRPPRPFDVMWAKPKGRRAAVGAPPN